jgi:hypothetical protein
MQGDYMSKKNDRFIFKRDDGLWVNKKISAQKLTSLHDTVV